MAFLQETSQVTAEPALAKGHANWNAPRWRRITRAGVIVPLDPSGCAGVAVHL